MSAFESLHGQFNILGSQGFQHHGNGRVSDPSVSADPIVNSAPEQTWTPGGSSGF